MAVDGREWMEEKVGEWRMLGRRMATGGGGAAPASLSWLPAAAAQMRGKWGKMKIRVRKHPIRPFIPPRVISALF
jgi:hypothetical protein